jgi:hypothetical protein
MTGNIDMTKHRLINLGDPEAQRDDVNLKFLDRFLKHDGSSRMTGTLNLGGYSITSCATSFGRGFSDESLRGQCCWFDSS